MMTQILIFRKIPSKAVIETNRERGGEDVVGLVHLPALQVLARMRRRAAVHAVPSHQTPGMVRSFLALRLLDPILDAKIF